MRCSARAAPTAFWAAPLVYSATGRLPQQRHRPHRQHARLAGHPRRVEPLSATASATRELFGNPGRGGDSWAVEHALALAVGWPLLLVAVFLPLAVHRWQRLSR